MTRNQLIFIPVRESVWTSFYTSDISLSGPLIILNTQMQEEGLSDNEKHASYRYRERAPLHTFCSL